MYFVITNKNSYDVDFQYQTGLNILLPDFTVCFVNIKNIHEFYRDKIWIRPVVVPNDAKITVEKFLKIDKIVLGNRFSLYSLKTIKKFNFKVITSDYINEVCKKGKTDILEWWKNSGLELKYSECALTFASENGHINVLEWWKNSGLELKYDEQALNWTSGYGQVEVLEWWKNSGLKLKYTKDALNSASCNGHINVLEWWKNSGLELKYTENALYSASCMRQVEVLEWWKNSGLELKYDTYVCALHWTSFNGYFEVLEWWKNSGLMK